MDNELILYDRLEVIKTTNEKYDLEHNSYLSFSGGKDSTILHYLLDMALPNNTIPRVFIDTGIEYTMIREFVLGLAKSDNRFIILKPTKNVKQVLETYGYPFKSKEHAKKVDQYWKSKKITHYLEMYLNPKFYQVALDRINGVDQNGQTDLFNTDFEQLSLLGDENEKD